MQTFLPYKSFQKSAKVLDNKRLGKQRVECLQILNTILRGDEAKGWKNHPAVQMWRGYELVLIEYGDAICAEWTSRGFRDTCREKINSLAKNFDSKSSKLPPFIGKKKFHDSHKSNLLRKDAVWYGQFGWNLPDNLEYFWIF